MATPTKNDRSAWLQGPDTRCTAIPEAKLPATRLILVGAPGVGKGTQADLLHQRLGACHLSTGDVFRTAGSHSSSPALQQALAHIRRGELVPDATVWELVQERRQCLRCPAGFILDGFPRTVAQAELLQTLMEAERLCLTAVLNYELPASHVVERLAGRRTCEGCKAVYHVTDRPPKAEGRCDRCGAGLFQREDDQPESIRVRLETYERCTAPLISFYSNLGYLVQVNATGLAEEIFDRTIAALAVRSVRPV